MRSSLLILLCLTVSAFAVVLPTPDFQWNFESVDAQGKISAAIGGLDAVPVAGFSYPCQAARFGKGVDLGEELRKNNTPCPGFFVPDLPTDFTRPFTVVTTLKLHDIVGSEAGYRAFKDIWGNTSTRGPGARLTVFYGQLVFHSGDGETGTFASTNNGKTAIPIGRFFQVAVVYDGTTARIFCDGKLAASQNITVTKGKYRFCIGAMNGSAYHLPGIVDDLKIYHHALTSDEVIQLYLDFAE